MRPVIRTRVQARAAARRIWSSANALWRAAQAPKTPLQDDEIVAVAELRGYVRRLQQLLDRPNNHVA